MWAFGLYILLSMYIKAMFIITFPTRWCLRGVNYEPPFRKLLSQWNFRIKIAPLRQTIFRLSAKKVEKSVPFQNGGYWFSMIAQYHTTKIKFKNKQTNKQTQKHPTPSLVIALVVLPKLAPLDEVKVQNCNLQRVIFWYKDPFMGKIIDYFCSWCMYLTTYFLSV